MRERARSLLVLTVLRLGAATPAFLPAAPAAEPIRFEIAKMGGIPIRVSVWGVPADKAEELRAGVDACLDSLEAKFSSYRQDSLVSRIGRGELSTVGDPDLETVLRTSARIARRTGGAFDITVGPLVALWRRARADGALPAEDVLARARARVGYALLGEDGLDVVRLASAGGSIDLGAVAKGYMADATLAHLRQRGVRRALVEIGGDMAVRNELNNAPFRVGIRHPLRRDRLLGVLEIDNGAVVTSGNYERGFEIAGRRYGHIIDPRTGRPTGDDPLSVTVVAPEGAEADAWATALYVLGTEEGSLLAAKDAIEALFVLRGPNGGLRIVGTPDILRRLQLRERVPTERADGPSSQ